MRFYLLPLVLSICIVAIPANAAETPRVNNPVVLEKPGSRSEIAHGSLIIDGVRVPETFGQVVVDGAEYEFRQRVNRWGEDGYFPSRRTVSFAVSDKPVSKSELARGWYDGDRLRSGTPKSWVFVRWAYGAHFVAPSSLAALVKTEAIENIDRFVGEEPFPTEGGSPVREELQQETGTDRKK